MAVPWAGRVARSSFHHEPFSGAESIIASTVRTHLVSYATADFEGVQAELNESAVRFKIESLFSYTKSNLLESAFYDENREILNRVCGAGYWAWKPYFILEALKTINDGDILIYADAGTRILTSPQPLSNICLQLNNGVLLFDCRPLTNAQFTKRDCFVRLDCDTPSVWRSNEVIATIVVLRKCIASFNFVSEWMKYCKMAPAITDDPNIFGKPNLPEFIQHRWDQAILSLLAAKAGIETYRNPTKWGNFLKMPEFRSPGELVAAPYNIPPALATYADDPQLNSPYGTIFEINRRPNMVGKVPFTLPASLGIERRASLRRSFTGALRRLIKP